MKVISILLLSLLLTAVFTQEDINLKEKKPSKKGPKTGGWQEVDVTNFGSQDEENLVNEAVDQSRKVYEEDNNSNKWGQLDEVLSVKKQIVAGVNYKILWSTVNGDHIEIEVYQVPWQQ